MLLSAATPCGIISPYAPIDVRVPLLGECELLNCGSDLLSAFSMRVALRNQYVAAYVEARPSTTFLFI